MGKRDTHQFKHSLARTFKRFICLSRGGGGGTRVSEWIRMSPPPPVMGLQSLPSPGIGLGFHSKYKNRPGVHFLGRFLTEEYVNLHRNQLSPALGRIFITYMICPGFGLVICEKTCPGFGLSFGFHGVHPYQKNICSHPPPPPSLDVSNVTSKNYVITNDIFNTVISKMANNKAACTDRITAFWIKKLTSVHPYLLSLLPTKNGKWRNGGTRVACHINDKYSAKKCR